MISIVSFVRFNWTFSFICDQKKYLIFCLTTSKRWNSQKFNLYLNIFSWNNKLQWMVNFWQFQIIIEIISTNVPNASESINGKLTKVIQHHAFDSTHKHIEPKSWIETVPRIAHFCSSTRLNSAQLKSNEIQLLFLHNF